MKYIVRIVVYYYDEFDTTLCDIYDVALTAQNASEATSRAQDRVSLEPKHASPGSTDLVGAVSNQADYKNLPKIFCSNGQTFFSIDMDGDNKSGCRLL